MYTGLRIAVITDSDGWHEARLAAAFESRGVEMVRLSLRDCRFDSDDSSGSQGLVLPGFDQTLPDGVLIRNVPGGSFEQVTLRLGILHALKACGRVVYNDAGVIERTVDKSMTGFLLARAGVPVLPTWVYESEQQARDRVVDEIARGHALVLKPLFGACGRGLSLIRQLADLPPPEQCGGVYYLQRFMASDQPGARDWRVLVIGGRAVAAMERQVDDGWITNHARGGQCLAAALTPALIEPAEAAAKAVGAGYAGVDLICDRSGDYRVLEVNGVPAWKGLQSVTSFDIATVLVDDLLKRVLVRQLEAVS